MLAYFLAGECLVAVVVFYAEVVALVPFLGVH